MNKLKLQLDDLAVETFETGHDAGAGRGTVHGHGDIPTIKPVCGETVLASNPSCCPCTPMV